MQRVLKSIISPFDVFYSKNGTFALGLHGCEHKRRAAAQILREKLRSMQLRRSVQTDGVSVRIQPRAKLLEFLDIAEAIFKNRLGKGRLSPCAQLRGEQHRHRVGWKAGKLHGAHIGGNQTLACAHAGAEVCHVDAAKGMVLWAKENAKVSGLEDKPIRWIVDDCAKFVEREIRRGKTYDAIIMDPPSYGRGPSGEVWKLDENLYPFVDLVSRVLSDDPLFFIINSYTTGLAPSVMRYLTETIVSKKYGGYTRSDELGLPVRDTGLALPCGATCRWTKEKP